MTLKKKRNTNRIVEEALRPLSRYLKKLFKAFLRRIIYSWKILFIYFLKIKTKNLYFAHIINKID